MVHPLGSIYSMIEGDFSIKTKTELVRNMLRNVENMSIDRTQRLSKLLRTKGLIKSGPHALC